MRSEIGSRFRWLNGLLLYAWRTDADWLDCSEGLHFLAMDLMELVRFLQAFKSPIVNGHVQKLAQVLEVFVAIWHVHGRGIIAHRHVGYAAGWVTMIDSVFAK